jgi:hypothetical protein
MITAEGAVPSANYLWVFLGAQTRFSRSGSLLGRRTFTMPPYTEGIENMHDQFKGTVELE